MSTQIKTAPAVETARRRIVARHFDALLSGYWWCVSCERVTERIESDQGQPAACGHCGSPRIRYHRALA